MCRSREQAEAALAWLREIVAELGMIPVEQVVAEMNMFLRGWAAYFRYGNSADRFANLSWYANQRLGLFLSKRYARGRRFGRWLVGVRQPVHLRLVSLSGIVVAPRPNRPWRGRAECRR
jgi:RNA-directed DNA polymerase